MKEERHRYLLEEMDGGSWLVDSGAWWLLRPMMMKPVGSSNCDGATDGTTDRIGVPTAVSCLRACVVARGKSCKLSHPVLLRLRERFIPGRV